MFSLGKDTQYYLIIAWSDGIKLFYKVHCMIKLD